MSLIEQYNRELYHYGVKGMKWGVRKEYEPVGRKRSNFKYKSDFGRAVKSESIHAAKLIVAMTIPGASLALNATTIAQIGRSAYLNTDGKKNYFDIEGPPEKISALKKKTAPSSIDDDLKRVNASYGKRGTVKNCMLCTSAMEMRRRGFDIQARSSGHGFNTLDFSKWYKGAKVESAGTTRNPKESQRKYAERSYNNLCDKLEANGPGARGALTLTYRKALSGHAMYWEVGNDGKVTIYDGQCKKKSGSGRMNDTLSMADPSSYEYVRLDNCELADEVTNTVRSTPEKRRA